MQAAAPRRRSKRKAKTVKRRPPRHVYGDSDIESDEDREVDIGGVPDDTPPDAPNK